MWIVNLHVILEERYQFSSPDSQMCRLTATTTTKCCFFLLAEFNLDFSCSDSGSVEIYFFSDNVSFPSICFADCSNPTSFFKNNY